MFAFLLESFTEIISRAGYPGLTFLMTLESMIAPVPSEAVMPFAGYLLYQQRMSWPAVIAASTLGSVIGSVLSYYIGARFGRELIVRYGRYLLLNEHHLTQTEAFFARYGEKTIFLSRFIPIVRHFISLPAGAAHMRLGRFLVYTLLGAGMWNFFLAWLGFSLGDDWGRIRQYSEKLDLVVLVLLAALFLGALARRRKK